MKVSLKIRDWPEGGFAEQITLNVPRAIAEKVAYSILKDHAQKEPFDGRGYIGIITVEMSASITFFANPPELPDGIKEPPHAD